MVDNYQNTTDFLLLPGLPIYPCGSSVCRGFQVWSFFTLRLLHNIPHLGHGYYIRTGFDLHYHYDDHIFAYHKNYHTSTKTGKITFAYRLGGQIWHSCNRVCIAWNLWESRHDVAKIGPRNKYMFSTRQSMTQGNIFCKIQNHCSISNGITSCKNSDTGMFGIVW